MLFPLFQDAKTKTEKAASVFNSIFYENRLKNLYRLGFVTVCLIVFIILSQETHFLGDGYAILGNLSSETGVFIKWIEKGATNLQRNIISLIGVNNRENTLTAFRLISYVSGAATLYFFFAIAGILSDRPFKRMLAFIALLFSGILLLFFGYVENYPPLWIFFSGFVFFSLYHLRTGKLILPAFIFLALGMYIHLQMAVFIPAFVYVLFARDKLRSIYEKYKIPFWIIAGLVVIASGFAFYIRYTTNLYFENMFLPPFKGKPIYPDYFLFSARHIIDIFNELILLAPLLPLFIAAAFLGGTKWFDSKLKVFLAVTAVGGLGSLIGIDPKLGMPRDWDLFSLSTMGIVLLFLLLIGKNALEHFKKLFPAMTAYLIIAVIPFFVTNLKTDPSISYMEYIIELDEKIALPSTIALRDYHRRVGNYMAADTLNQLLPIRFPEFKRQNMIDDALVAGDFKRALQLISSGENDIFSDEHHRHLSIIYQNLGRLDEAIVEAELAMQLQNYSLANYVTLAQAYARKRKYDKAATMLKRGLVLDSTHYDLLTGLAHTHKMMGQFDSAIYYANRILKLDSGSAEGYFLNSQIYALKRQMDSAVRYYELYSNYGIRDRLYEEKLSALEHLIFQKGNK